MLHRIHQCPWACFIALGASFLTSTMLCAGDSLVESIESSIPGWDAYRVGTQYSAVGSCDIDSKGQRILVDRSDSWIDVRGEGLSVIDVTTGDEVWSIERADLLRRTGVDDVGESSRFVGRCAISGNGNVIGLVTYDQPSFSEFDGAQLWTVRLDGQNRLTEIASTEEGVYGSVDLSGHGSRIAVVVGGRRDTRDAVEIRDTASGRLLEKVPCSEFGMPPIAFHPCCENLLIIHDRESMTEHRILSDVPAPESLVSLDGGAFRVGYTLNGCMMWAGSSLESDGTSRLWRRRRGDEWVHVGDIPGGSGVAVASRRHVITGQHDKIVLWDLESEEVVAELEADGIVRHVIQDAAGDVVVVMCSGPGVIILRRRCVSGR